MRADYQAKRERVGDAGLRRLLTPRSVAIIGASDDPDRIGGRPVASMLSRGFEGRILPVNPNRSTVQGLPAYASVADLPEAPDVAIVAVPQALAAGAVADLAARGAGSAIVFTAGFSEVGEAGAHRERQMADVARRSGMRLLGPNCLGVLNMHTRFLGTFASVLATGTPCPGVVGIASQSGAYGAHLIAMAMRRRIGVSQCVMTGNEADVTVGDIVRQMADDDATEIIAVYLEGLNDPAAILAGLDAAYRARKPVVVMKAGRSPIGREAAQSHTASIACDDAVLDAVLSEYGAVRAKTTEQMMDICHLATRRIFPAGNTLGVMTISGGAGILISDAAHARGLPMPRMPAEVEAALKRIQPMASAVNPVDCTGQFLNDETLIGRFSEAMFETGLYRTILGFFTYTGGIPATAARLIAHLGPLRARHPDTLVVLCLLGAPEVVASLEEAGFTVFEDLDRAVAAISAVGRIGDAFARAPLSAPPVVDPVVLPCSTPSEVAGKALLAGIGIPAAPEAACADADAAVAAAESLGFPVVMKILSPDILHKSEIGGVLLDVADAGAVRAGFATLLDRAARHTPTARLEGVVVARQLKGGVECILGITRDPAFGPVAMVGLGGIFVEILRDVALRRCPFGEAEAEAMIRGLRGAPLLMGARGRPPADIPALARVLSRLSAFAAGAGPTLASIDLNPVLVMPAGQGAYVADAVIEIDEGGA